MQRDLLAEELRPYSDIDAHSRSGIRWLIDNAVAYRAMIDAAECAQHTIRISQLAFDADCVSYDADGVATRLIDVLVEAAARGVGVRIILNESMLLDTAAPLRRALARMNASSIEVRGISRFPQLIHAKLLIVDDTDAIIVGSPFVNGYWDDENHAPHDARRPARELGGRALHDLSVHVSGPTCRALIDFHEELWNAGHAPGSHTPAGGVTPDDGIAIVSTLPKGVGRRHDGCTDILDAMLDGISRAERLIYLEHQYLSSRRVVAALAHTLARKPDLQIIALLNQNPDVTAYRVWQKDRLGEYGLLEHPRVGLFSLWTCAARSGAPTPMNQVFVHSKVLIVDDQWATVGSANVDGVSLHSYGADFKSRLGERIFRHTRNIDLNLVLEGQKNIAIAKRIEELRCALWREHLGESTIQSLASTDLLTTWRTKANQNIATLTDVARRGEATGSIILPFSTAANPAEQLERLGITLTSIDLQFDPGWIEVHCSPNWIRNMFS